MRAAKLVEWRLHASTRAFARRVREAEAVIAQALTTTPQWVISWSTGKDSTVLAHLVRTLDSTVPIVTQFDDCDWPTKRAYAMRVAARLGWTITEVIPSFSVWERARQYAIGFEDLCAPSHDLTQSAFLEPLRAARLSHGATGVFLGLRIEESRARQIHLATRGPLYETQGDGWRCCPLARWSAADVFAYHVMHNIEINPCYWNNRFWPPEQIRISWALPTPKGRTRGDLAHLRLYYPAQFRRLRETCGIV